MKSRDFRNHLRGIEHFVLVTQIIILKRKEENLVLIYSKKEKEGRNIFFSKKNQKERKE